jgi:hypothetical protein
MVYAANVKKLAIITLTFSNLDRYVKKALFLGKGNTAYFLRLL